MDIENIQFWKEKKTAKPEIYSYKGKLALRNFLKNKLFFLFRTFDHSPQKCKYSILELRGLMRYNKQFLD